MDSKVRQNLADGYEASYIDDAYKAYSDYKPDFVSNDYREGRKVISALEQEMASCDGFMFSVAFISLGGITPLLQTFKELEEKGIHGRILTTDYETFTSPAALDKLHEFKNIEIKMYSSDEDRNGFHTKGYIFKHKDIYHIIVGSSNMTGSALAQNREWNTRLIGLENGETIKSILKEAEALWNDPASLRYEDAIDAYRTRYDIVEEQKRRAREGNTISFERYTLQPNAMQTAFVENLRELLDRNESKALLISATGTGKTYASAFGLRDMNPDRLLFVVHRERIARQAMESYMRVFGPKKRDGSDYKYALLAGGASVDSAKTADLVFATMQTMCRDDVLNAFGKNDFTAVCLDEAHHSGADSYKKIMNYFEPKLWLGMTASPDTNRFNVYEIFDHNIAYEIRLQQALEENLLCPFHYFGITDLAVDGQVIGDADGGKGLENFERLVCDDRVKYILKEAKFYGHSGSRVKGLVFCSRIEEARTLSKKFNERGLKTIALSGDDSDEERENAIDLLEKDLSCDDVSRGEYLDYIFTVDIFSEGVDIPEINQVIMLRPTKSAVVFVQQLGRGLRISRGKEFVVVLDFIGNYNNNFMIPMALSGDRSYNKDNIRRYVCEGDRVIPGVSTIHFDEISKKRIYDAVDRANFSDIKLIRENYTNLKYKLGRIPALKEFDEYGEMDVCRIFDNPALGSYHRFLVKYETDYKVRLSSRQDKAVEFISKKILPGKRPHELELLSVLLDENRRRGDVKEELKASLKKYGISLSDGAFLNVSGVMTGSFLTGTGASTYSECVFIEEDGDTWRVSKAFEEDLKNDDFYGIVKELTEFGLHRYNRDFSGRYRDTDFVLYQKYNYEDVCRLLGWEKNVVPQNIGGYKYDEKTRTLPVFINYVKGEGIADTIRYEDRFVSRDTFIHISKSKRHIGSPDIQNMLKTRDGSAVAHLFVRRNKDDNISKEFYYLGIITATGDPAEITMARANAPAVEIEWTLDTPVREDIYNYITME